MAFSRSFTEVNKSTFDRNPPNIQAPFSCVAFRRPPRASRKILDESFANITVFA